MPDIVREVAAVRKERPRSGLRRYKRLQKLGWLGCLRVGTKVVASGVTPCVSYGAAPLCTHGGGPADDLTNGQLCGR